MDHELWLILQRLAASHWMTLRKSHNRQFMAFGPGTEWDRYKESDGYKKECGEIRLLRGFCGLSEDG